ncbi:MAG TPA: hypothetical protein VFR86_27805 [Burkholderiaceae bacterium]|nr:hypothetical protein [Burkholderiaceae bacterium]
MVRELDLTPTVALPGFWRRWTAAVLIAASGALARLAARLEQPRAESATAAVEFDALEIGGRRCGAVYENGRLVGWLPDVHRL